MAEIKLNSKLPAHIRVMLLSFAEKIKSADNDTANFAAGYVLALENLKAISEKEAVILLDCLFGKTSQITEKGLNL